MMFANGVFHWADVFNLSLIGEQKGLSVAIRYKFSG